MGTKNKLWELAKQKCKLSEEAIAKAKELGLNPKSLIKNIPSKTESWKKPVSAWIDDLYNKRFHK